MGRRGNWCRKTRGSKWVASWALFLQRNEGVSVEPDTRMLSLTAGRLHHASLSGSSEIKEQFSKLAWALCAGVGEFRPPRRRIGAEPSIMTSSDQTTNRQRMKRLVEKPGNGTCADCGAAGRSVGVRIVSVNASREFQSTLSDAFEWSSCWLRALYRRTGAVSAGNPGDRSSPSLSSSSLAESGFLVFVKTKPK